MEQAIGKYRFVALAGLVALVAFAIVGFTNVGGPSVAHGEPFGHLECEIDDADKDSVPENTIELGQQVTWIIEFTVDCEFVCDEIDLNNVNGICLSANSGFEPAVVFIKDWVPDEFTIGTLSDGCWEDDDNLVKCYFRGDEYITVEIEAVANECGTFTNEADIFVKPFDIGVGVDDFEHEYDPDASVSDSITVLCPEDPEDEDEVVVNVNNNNTNTNTNTTVVNVHSSPPIIFSAPQPQVVQVQPVAQTAPTSNVAGIRDLPKTGDGSMASSASTMLIPGLALLAFAALGLGYRQLTRSEE